MTASRAAVRRAHSLIVGIAAFLGVALAPAATAGLVDTLPKIKPSVVAIGTYQRTRSPAFRFLGTGFAVGSGAIVATNAHVLPDAIADDKMETLAIAVPGENQAAVRKAERLAVDKNHDLAVLRIDGAPLPALPLLDSGAVLEGQNIAMTGFPIGAVLGLAPVTHRGIIAAITPIGIPQARARQLDPALVRRLATDPFRVYQLDATTYPGSSGSPVFDPDTGRVLGVVNMVFVKSTKENILSDPSGISYAIPVEHLKALLQGID